MAKCKETPTSKKEQQGREPPPDRIGRSKTERQQKRKARSTKNTSKVHPKSQKTLVSRRIEVGRSQAQGRGGGRQGLHCGEANPNQKLGEKK